LFSSVGRFLDDYFPEILNVVGSLLLAIGGIGLSSTNPSSISLYIFVGGGIGNLIGVLWSAKRGRDFRKIEDELNHLKQRESKSNGDYSRMMNDQLSIIYHGLELTDRERISIYRHHDKNFTLLGRYSLNPQFCVKGRVFYPFGQGVIGKAWEKGKASRNGFSDPITNWELYVKEHTKYGFDELTVGQFSMKSRAYIAMALVDVRTQRRVAIVVIESSQAKVPKCKQIEEKIGGTIGKMLAFLVESRKEMEPDVGLARTEGF
jgi:hypothetical protein